MSYLAEPQSNAFRDAKKDSSIGKLLLEAGKLTPEQADSVLQAQKARGIRFGEAAIALGYVTRADIEQAVARQFDYSYLQPGEGGYPEQLLAAYAPFSPQVESLRALRSQLILRWFSTGRKSLAVVNIDQDPGASMFVANLAVVFSQLGEQTLLVDGNLRQPQQHGIFRTSGRVGLSDVLAGRADLSAIVRIEGFKSLSVLPGGTLAPNPHELLHRDTFRDLDTEVAAAYDIVLYDAPSVASGADATALAVRAGGVLIVARKHKARMADLRVFREQMQRTGTRVVAVVLID